MTVKMTVQGGLIYLTLVFFVATIIEILCGWLTIGNALWGNRLRSGRRIGHLARAPYRPSPDAESL